MVIPTTSSAIPRLPKIGPSSSGTSASRDALKRRGPNYLNALMRNLGDAADQSGVVLPTRPVASTDELDLGGRILSLRAWKTAHTDNDLTVFDQASRTLWLGDLLFVGHVPVVDGNLKGFLAAIDEIKVLRASLVIPGHGRALGWPEAMAAEERYLMRLRDDVRAAIKAKRTLAETLASVDEGREQWLLFDQFHKRNVSAAYAELEWDE